MPGVFVTATGTDVGKTYVTAGLIRACRRAGRAVDALKPVMSGFDREAPARSDAGELIDALGRWAAEDEIARIAPWRFAAPLSPDMASALEGERIDFDAVVATCRSRLYADTWTFVEGVGGVMVPLDERHTILDLMEALALPIVLVAPTGLGAISHCLTACAALRSRRLRPTLLVLDETAGSTVPLQMTIETLTRFLPGVLAQVVPRHAAAEHFDRLFETLSSALSAQPTTAG